jgi:PilZ domain
MSSGAEKRKTGRVEFSRGIPVRIVAIDGTWSRDCLMLDVAAGGAKLTVKESVTGLNLKEFFLVLSTTGAAYRRCELVWLNGDQLGVRFLEATDRLRKRSSPS